MKRIFSLLLIACCLVLFTGCSKDEGRSNVSGTITLNGEPLVGGYIDFIPLDPPPGVAVVTGNATIVNGKYAIEGKLGLLPGEYKVKIMAQRRIDKKNGQGCYG